MDTLPVSFSTCSSNSLPQNLFCVLSLMIRCLYLLWPAAGQIQPPAHPWPSDNNSQKTMKRILKGSSRHCKRWRNNIFVGLRRENWSKNIMYWIFCFFIELFCTKRLPNVLQDLVNILHPGVLSKPRTLLCIAGLHSCKVALASLSLTYNRHTGQLIFPTPCCSANFKRSDWCYCIDSGFKRDFEEREKKALLEQNNTVVKSIDFPVLLLLCGCKQYGSRHTCPCGKVDGTRLTEGGL